MANYYYSDNFRTPPRWAADGIHSGSLIPGGARVDPLQFPSIDAVTITLSAQANAAAVALAVAPLAFKNAAMFKEQFRASGPAIPAGTLLWFGAGKFARVTADAAIGANQLTVEALVAQINNASTTTFQGRSTIKTIPAGTLIGRTFAERAAGTAFGPADVANDDEIYLVAQDCTDASITPEVELYRPTCIVFENYLPEYSGLSAETLAKIRDLYTCTLGG